MTFTPNGAFPDQTEFVGAGTLALDNTAVGDLILLVALSVDSSANYVTGITGGGVTWEQAGAPYTGTVNAEVATAWLGTVTATGPQTAAVAVTGGSPTIAIVSQEFSAGGGGWALDSVVHLDSAGTSTWPTVTPAGGGPEVAFGFAIDQGIAVAGSTPGWTYKVTSHNDACAYDTSVSAPSAAVWGDSGQGFGAVILVKGAAQAQPGGGSQVVAVNAGAREVVLPNGLRYQGGDSGIVLSGDQYARLSPGAPVTAAALGGTASYACTVRAGLHGVLLPTGQRAKGGDSVTLADWQYGLMTAEAVASIFSSVTRSVT